MKASRRSILQLIGFAPVAAPMVAQSAAEAMALPLLGFGSGSGGQPPNTGPPTVTSPIGGPFVTDAHKRFAVQIPHIRAQVREIIREEEFTVTHIDPDIAVLRSFSINAKICFQRQRNIERRLDHVGKVYSWDRITELVRNTLGGMS